MEFTNSNLWKVENPVITEWYSNESALDGFRFSSFELQWK